jgi:hypothetical protein
MKKTSRQVPHRRTAAIDPYQGRRARLALSSGRRFQKLLGPRRHLNNGMRPPSLTAFQSPLSRPRRQNGASLSKGGKRISIRSIKSASNAIV